jgi:hypothetical protein
VLHYYTTVTPYITFFSFFSLLRSVLIFEFALPPSSSSSPLSLLGTMPGLVQYSALQYSIWFLRVFCCPVKVEEACDSPGPFSVRTTYATRRARSYHGLGELFNYLFFFFFAVKAIIAHFLLVLVLIVVPNLPWRLEVHSGLALHWKPNPRRFRDIVVLYCGPYS